MQKVSVIVPVYNKQEYVEQCIKSIQMQSYRELEILVIDDGSTDNSYNVCKELSLNDNRIKLLQKKNGGHSDARNFGLIQASHDLIMFVDADDYLIL